MIRQNAVSEDKLGLDVRRGFKFTGGFSAVQILKLSTGKFASLQEKFADA